MKSTFIICHINNEPQIKNSIFAEKGKNIEHVFLNDENKRSWGGDETMSEEIYEWTIMTEIKINPDLISALRKYIKFKHQQQWKINEYPIKGKYSWTESFLWTHIYWAVATSQNAKISNHTLPDKPRVQEGKVQMSWNCSKPRKLGSKRGSAAWKISLLATTQPKPRSVGLHVIFPNLSQICHKI